MKTANLFGRRRSEFLLFFNSFSDFSGVFPAETEFRLPDDLFPAIHYSF